MTATDQTDLQMLLQLTGVGVVQTDLEIGRFLRANEAFCEMVGYSKAELRGMTYAELTHPAERVRRRQLCRTSAW